MEIEGKKDRKTTDRRKKDTESAEWIQKEETKQYIQKNVMKEEIKTGWRKTRRTKESGKTQKKRRTKEGRMTSGEIKNSDVKKR